MESMPSDVFNRSIVVNNLSERWIFWIFEFVFLDVPDANFFIGLPWEENVVVDGVPGEAVSFWGMADEFADRLLHGHKVNFSIGWRDGE
jgi:hypothetical protein